MSPKQRQRAEEEARRIARSRKDRARYEAKQMEKARQAVAKVRDAEEAKTALVAREAERARLRAEYDAKQREESRLYWEKWHRGQAERDVRNRLDAANMADARRSQEANGNDRAYCRLYVSKDGGSDQPETPDARRCWLLPGHEGRCQPEPPRPVKGGGGRGLGLLLMAAALWGAA